jgi:hypothetical protein
MELRKNVPLWRHIFVQRTPTSEGLGGTVLIRLCLAKTAVTCAEDGVPLTTFLPHVITAVGPDPS